MVIGALFRHDYEFKGDFLVRYLNFHSRDIPNKEIILIRNKLTEDIQI